MYAMISAMGSDILTGDDFNCVSFAKQYWAGSSLVIDPTMLTPTINAMNFIKSLLPSILNNILIIDGYPVVVPQYRNFSYSDGNVAALSCDTLMTLITRISAEV
jgi:hypothetical protein